MHKRAARAMFHPTRRRQSGAVVVLLAVALVVLLAFAALVIDLGRTYVVRTELQNAADAMALAGAKQLDQTKDGAGSAKAYARAMGKQHRFDFGIPLIGQDDVDNVTVTLSLGSCPDDTGCNWDSIDNVTTNAAAAGRTFLKVEISSPALRSSFAALLGVTSTATYGRAVAGRYLLEVTPIGVCAIEATARRFLPGTTERVEYGFRRGVSYNIFELGPLGAPSDPYLLNPVDPYPGPCEPNNSSTNVTAPFICTGAMAVPAQLPGSVYGNTGVSAGQIEKALNSRFDIYGPGGSAVCTPTLAPPDTNVRPFGYAAGVDWMTPAPTRQTMSPPQPEATRATAGDYGVLWSYSRAVRADGTTVDPTAADWGALYPVAGGSTPAPTPAYPASSPYADAGHTTPPSPAHPGKAERRVVNLLIANCAGVQGSGGCSRIPVSAAGRFFMQVPADFSGGTKKLQVEFAGLLDPRPAEIKLYR